MEKGKRKNKKGSVLDFFYIIAAMFLIAVILVVSYIVVDTADSTDIFQEDITAQNAIDTSKSTILSLDNLMLFVIVGLSLAVLISSFLIYQHPAFLVISFFLLLIAIVVAAIASNTIWTFFNAEAITEAADNFPKLTFLFNNFPYYVLFLGILSIIAGGLSAQRQ